LKKILLLIAFTASLSLGSIYFFKPGIAIQGLYRIYLLQAKLDAKTLQVGETRFHYYEGGTGRDLILIHGFGDSKVSFVQMVSKLKGHYHVILPDVPGFGESEKVPGQNHSIGKQMERIYQFTEALGIKKAAWAGNSMGGHIAAAMAIHHPEKVQKLMVLSPAGLLVDDPIPYREVDHPLRNDEDFELYMKQVFFIKPWIPNPFQKEFSRNSQLSFDWNNGIRKNIREGADYLLNDQIAQIKCPTLIIWGKADGVVRVAHAPIWNEKIQGSKLIIIDDLGHSPQYENPAKTADLIESFLNESEKN
jgi:pimeloyl-ACP methyl ester carboxylesterase